MASVRTGRSSISSERSSTNARVLARLNTRAFIDAEELANNLALQLVDARFLLPRARVEVVDCHDNAGMLLEVDASRVLVHAWSGILSESPLGRWLLFSS